MYGLSGVSSPDNPSDPGEALAERLVREAIERGDFDRLPGAGLPLEGAGTKDDPLWWVRAWVERNRDR